LTRRWLSWLIASFAAFLVWIIPTALIVNGDSVPGLQFVADLGSVLASVTISFAVIALFLKFAATPSPVLGRISVNAYPIYLVHYLFVIWLQYLLLGADWFALVKAALVFGGTLLMSWAVAALLSSIPIGALLLQGKQGLAMKREPVSSSRKRSLS
jgi:surface polysaccharide O-acyltransferase-like enzyme